MLTTLSILLHPLIFRSDFGSQQTYLCPGLNGGQLCYVMPEWLPHHVSPIIRHPDAHLAFTSQTWHILFWWMGHKVCNTKDQCGETHNINSIFYAVQNMVEGKHFLILHIVKTATIKERAGLKNNGLHAFWELHTSLNKSNKNGVT